MRGLASAAVLLTACSTSFAVDAGERGDAAPHDAGRPDAGVVRILDASRPPPACVGLTIDAGPHHVADSGFVCCCCGTVVWHFTDCAVGACDGFCPGAQSRDRQPGASRGAPAGANAPGERAGAAAPSRARRLMSPEGVKRPGDLGGERAGARGSPVAGEKSPNRLVDRP